MNIPDLEQTRSSQSPCGGSTCVMGTGENGFHIPLLYGNMPQPKGFIFHMIYFGIR